MLSNPAHFRYMQNVFLKARVTDLHVCIKHLSCLTSNPLLSNSTCDNSAVKSIYPHTLIVTRRPFHCLANFSRKSLPFSFAGGGVLQPRLCHNDKCWISRSFSSKANHSQSENLKSPIEPQKSSSSNQNEELSKVPGKRLSKLEKLVSLGADEIINERKVRADMLGDIRENWITVYRFPYIRAAGLIQRLKLLHTVITCFIILPGTLGCYLYDVTSMDVVAFYGSASLLAAVMLYVMGTFCSRLIGFIYVSKNDSNVVRVAHMSFWGKRIDELYAKNDFLPFSELEDNLSDIYINVKFYSNPEEKLHLCLRYGKIFDKTQFHGIFGSHGLLTLREGDKTKRKNS